MISNTLPRQDDKLRRQLDVRFFSMWYYTQREVDILTRRNRLVMNWYSFLGHEYSFFNAIVSHLFTLKILKRHTFLGFLPPESPPGLCPRPQAVKAIALQSLFSLIKLNLLPKNRHKLKCLDKSLIISCCIGLFNY